MKNTSISLSPHFQEMIRDLVESGRYASASDVVREGLRLMEAREAAIRRLDAAIDEGLASGPAVEFDMEEFLDRKRGEYEYAEAAE